MAQISEQTFAPEMDQPIRYIERTRSYYLGLGYDNPYVWAHYVKVPFTRLQKPLSQSVLGLITTAVQFDPSKGDQGPGAPYNAAAKFYEPYKNPINQKQDLRIAHVGIDRKNANMEESECWFPLAAARRVVEMGRLQMVSPNFYGLPDDVFTQILRGVQNSGALEYTQAAAKREADLALSCIQHFPENEATSALRALCEYSLARQT